MKIIKLKTALDKFGRWLTAVFAELRLFPRIVGCFKGLTNLLEMGLLTALIVFGPYYSLKAGYLIGVLSMTCLFN